jgi:hypothetical protein
LSDLVLALTSPHMTGGIVARFQQDMNGRLDVWGVPFQVDVDGDYGAVSRDTARSLLYGLGVDLSSTDFDGVSESDRTKIRHGWEALDADEQRRWKARADWRQRFAARYGGGAVESALTYARQHIGVTESPANSNRGPLIDQWERACGVIAAPWCGCFANACLVAAGFPDQFWVRYCPSIEAKAKAGDGSWKWIGADGEVRLGDLVLYGVREAVHVGMVETIQGGRDTGTIEGNTSNGPGGSQSNGGVVARRHRHTDGSLNGFPIRGYARPPY